MMFAYIDVALGSMALQAAAGCLFAGVIMGRRLFALPLAWLGFQKASLEPTDEPQE